MNYPILKFFTCEHLSGSLREVSSPLCDVAHYLASKLPQCAETAAGLRKLIEAKDCFVRAELEREEAG